jgi:hypothetical protein
MEADLDSDPAKPVFGFIDQTILDAGPNGFVVMGKMSAVLP